LGGLGRTTHGPPARGHLAKPLRNHGGLICGPTGSSNCGGGPRPVSGYSYHVPWV